MSNNPLITKFEKLVKDLNTIIFGDDDQDVILDGIVKPTISKWLRSIVTDLNEAIEIAAAAGAGANGWTDLLVQTWSGRTQESKNKDLIHVLDFKVDGKTDQQTIQDAVNYCLANNRTLDWDGAHLTSTGNVLNMWDVTHIGNGSITRNGNVFYFNNIGKESTIHVAKYVAGILPVNDGLSFDFPIYPEMINRFFDNFNVLHGNYVFQFKAEVYANCSLNRVYMGGLDRTASNINQLSGAIIFRGADVGFNFDSLANATAIPTTVFGSESTSTNNLLFNLRNANYRFESIKGINQNSIVAISDGSLVVRNAHGLGNVRDIQSLKSFLDVTGGILDGGVNKVGSAITSFFLSKHNIGSQANTAQKTPIIRRKSTGFLVQEGSTGHSDFVTYEDCTFGSIANVNARINTNGSTYTNCEVGVRASNGGNVYVPDNVVFNNCIENVRIQNSEIISNIGTPQFSYADKEVRVFTSVTPLSTTTNTRELVSRIEMPPFALKSGGIGPIWQGKKVKIVCRGVITGVGGTKRFDIYAAADPTATTGNYITNATTFAESNGSFEFVVELIISSNIVCSSKILTSISTQRVFLNNNIIDSNLFATRPFILLTCWCESVSDKVKVHSVECYTSS